MRYLMFTLFALTFGLNASAQIDDILDELDASERGGDIQVEISPFDDFGNPECDDCGDGGGCGAPEFVPLGKTLRLEFEMSPGDDENMSITSAGTYYALEAEIHSGEDEDLLFIIQGGLSLLEDHVVAITFDAEIEAQSEEGEFRFSAAGSVTAKIGSKAELATFGDQKLIVRVTELK
jgi:hypothetical protein